MQKGQYIVIKVADIKEKIKSSKARQKMYGQQSLFYIYLRAEIRTLKQLLANSKDLYDVVGDAYDMGYFSDHISIDSIEKAKQDYLNNLEI